MLKKIQALKKEKETLALNYEQEEECLTNDLSRKLNQVLVFIFAVFLDLLVTVSLANAAEAGESSARANIGARAGVSG